MIVETRQKRIGIFDSGIGGITVLRELYRQLPSESILYFGDTARLPYGTRTSKEIVQFVDEIIELLIKSGVKMVLMACNTSSALALEEIKSKFDIPILGLIVPGANYAVELGTRIGVIATPATAASNAYRTAILEANSSAKVWQVSCPYFVPLIEQNQLHNPYTYQIAEEYLMPLIQQKIDTLVYGCTHYPYLEPILRSFLPRNINFVDPAVSLVKVAAKKLEMMNLQNYEKAKPTKFVVSGSPQKFAELSLQWLGYKPIVQSVSLSTVLDKPIYMA
ncbi:MAG: glutamate racemase [Okeania sp. SIO2C2]|uniref:glutamate racemase n=1 Tax=Okeania sp. SIO2C2 TaxID=2607787 RepID=UPI0013BA8014|nr:glutamate racemase [Okeania sp. SIO2C2]NEP89966.1 glutamate racemase [Okeania sp. SIO2C2]